MKFTVLKDNLLKSLNVVNKAVNPRSTIPVLSNVLIRTEKGRLKLNTSDLQVTVSAWVGAKIDTEGEITIPSRLLAEFVNQISDEKINFDLEGLILKVSTEKVKATFSGMTAAEFPDIEATEEGINIDLDSTEFNKALQYVGYSAATDDGRPVLRGLLFKTEDTDLIIASTDGFRMAEYRIKLKKKIKEEIACIVPAKALIDIVKTFTSISKSISIRINPKRNVVLFHVEDMEAQIRMIDGDFPDYESVVPDEFTTSIKFAKSDLTNAIRLASIFSRDAGNTVKIIASESEIKTLSQPSETGTNSSLVKGDFTGSEIEIAFNAKYLLDFLTNINEDEIEFQALESLKPGMFRTLGNENYFYLVMPVKANW